MIVEEVTVEAVAVEEVDAVEEVVKGEEEEMWRRWLWERRQQWFFHYSFIQQLRRDGETRPVGWVRLPCWWRDALVG